MSSLFKPSFNFGSKKKDNEDDEYSFGNDTLDPMSQYSNLAHLQGPLVGADKVSNPYQPPPTGKVGGITGRLMTGRSNLMTSQGTEGDQRPMTSVKGAGFQSKNGKGGGGGGFGTGRAKV